MIRIVFIAFFVCPLFSMGESIAPMESKKSGYRYIIDKYFSKKRSVESYNTYARNFNLFVGSSFFRESTDKRQSALSSVILGFNQRVREISNIGDLNLQVAVYSSQMKHRRAFLLELSPRVTIPEARSSFPLYLGLAVGVGFYPRYFIREIPSLSVSSQFFTGLRLLDIYHNLGLSVEINLRIHAPFSEERVYLENLIQLGLALRF